MNKLIILSVVLLQTIKLFAQNEGDYAWPKNFNIQLKHLADSTMKSIFGETGFSKNFVMSCLQNPCEKGYFYNGTFESNKPCSSEPQDSCKEAIVSYRFAKSDIPFTVKILVTRMENGNYVQIENNPFGKNKIAIEKQNLLGADEIQKIIAKKFPKDSIKILTDNITLAYAHHRIRQPETKDNGKLNRDSGKRRIKETKAGKNWENGFIYGAQSHNPRKPKRIFYFDAVTGKLLWITEMDKVTNHNLSH